jgi:hypothetical protein
MITLLWLVIAWRGRLFVISPYYLLLSHPVLGWLSTYGTAQNKSSTRSEDHGYYYFY